MNKRITRIIKALAVAYVATAVIVVCTASIHAAAVTIPAYPAPPAAAEQPGKGHQAANQAEEPQVMQPLWVVEPTAEVDKPYYALTAVERELVESIVMAEAGNQGLTGQMLVAQCILTACLDDDIRPAEAIQRYKYTKPHPEPTESVREAVAAVFDAGELPSDADIKYFYSPRYCNGSWHETQVFVLEYRDHKFFSERRVSE